MSFDRETLACAIGRHGAVARVVVADVAGSAPRERGASMLVWPGGQSGTIGGGALEFQAAQTARDSLIQNRDRLDRIPLGPGVGQCCGGRVDLLTEVWTETRLTANEGPVIARPGPHGPQTPSLAVRRVLALARNGGSDLQPTLIDGWMIEPVNVRTREIWIYGAGHVGRALVDVLAPLPGLVITWVDTGAERFPEKIPSNVTPLVAANPADATRHAPDHTEHLILTYSHALDLEICHRLLSRGFRSVGLIGSQTKWARFRKRLAALGHAPAQIARIDCPIGDPALGKHPHAIAIGVASTILQTAGTAVDGARSVG